MPGRYKVLEKLAEGGMGVVYKVYDQTLEVVRVMKLVRRQLFDEPGGEGRKRFLEEAKMAAKMGTHPNFVTLHTFEIDQAGIGYLVMELVDGVDLHKGLSAWRTSRRAGLPAEFCVEVGVQTLTALGFLHGQRLVHRDISPDNLMITLDSQDRPLLKLIDLGIAKSVDAGHGLTMQGVVGPRKSQYVAPERLSGQPADGRSDLYSLAVTLYKLLTGHLPFSGGQREVEFQHLLAPPRSFVETDPEGRVPEALRSVILQGLEKGPDDRYQEAAEFSRELKSVGLDRERVAASTTRLLLREGAAHTTWTEVRPEDSVQENLDILFPHDPSLTTETPSKPDPTEPSVAQAQPFTGPTVPLGQLRVDPAGRRRWFRRLAIASVSALALAVLIWSATSFSKSIRAGREAEEEEPAGRLSLEDAPPVEGDALAVETSAEQVQQPETDPSQKDTSPAALPPSEVESESARARVPQPSPPVRSSTSLWPPATRASEERVNPKDGLYYIWIPAGTFRFGCSPGDDLCEDDEKPASEEQITPGFWMSRTEVTVRAYKKLQAAAFQLPLAPPFNAEWRDEAQAMVAVTRTDAAGFCERAGARLPTEVEWEYAARAGEKRGRPARLERIAWFAANSDSRLRTVSQKEPNDFGLFDMLGNAAEWVAPGPAQPAAAGVLRGGSWLHESRYVRFSFRLLDSPARRDAMYGFRCVVDGETGS